MIEKLTSAWQQSSLAERILAGVTGLLGVTFVIVLVAMTGIASDLQNDLDKTESEVEKLDSENDQLASGLAAAEEQLSSANATIAELEETLITRQQELEDATKRAAELDADLSTEIAQLENSLEDAVAEKEEAEQRVAELLLTYSDEIDAARATIAGEARGFACDWGTTRATDGQALDTVTGQAALDAFSSSETFQQLRDDPEIATLLSVADTVGEPPYGISTDEAQTVAVECWQAEDARVNAALYEHQEVLQSAALEAACLYGVTSDLYEDRDSDGYWFTATLQEWFLDTGFENAGEYIDSVRGRFGSLEEFLAVPESELQSEAQRCQDRRNLISPKSSGTWNVGDEISTGTWLAFDASDCYWARLAENGDIRDNHFGDALRISVNVRSSDGQFEIDGCRFYYAKP